MLAEAPPWIRREGGGVQSEGHRHHRMRLRQQRLHHEGNDIPHHKGNDIPHHDGIGELVADGDGGGDFGGGGEAEGLGWKWAVGVWEEEGERQWRSQKFNGGESKLPLKNLLSVFNTNDMKIARM